jgi:hypothetical protein
MEIGASAINFLMATWQGHLTPSEAASMADKASKSRDPPMVRAAADLALSVLPQAAALNPNEIQRAIQQCREQSHAMLEKACNAVERASAHGSVDPAVMLKWVAIGIISMKKLCHGPDTLKEIMALMVSG